MTDGRKTNYHHVDAQLRYAKVFYDNRDMGRPGTEVDYSDTDGQYQVEVLVTADQKAAMIEQGIPEISMGYNQFKKEGDDLWAYRLKRPQKSKSLKENDGSAVVFGPPVVFDYNLALAAMKDKGGKLGDHIVPWDMHSDGLIGNGSKAYVTYTVYKNGKKRIIKLEKIGIYEHVKYEGQAPVDGDMVMF
jgi:hypothetical protein